MALSGTIPGTTTLAALIDLIYANKTGSLTGASATFTALEANRILVSWPGVNNGDNVVHVVAQGRPVIPAVMKHS